MANMVLTLKRVFGNEDMTNVQTEKTEVAPTVFYNEEPNETEDTLYTARGRGYGNQGMFPSRGSSRGRPRKRFLNSYRNRSFGRNKINPLNKDGEPRGCFICNSIYHLAKYCPNASYKDDDNYDRNDRNKGGRGVNWSMFVGCASSRQNTKLEDLIDETDGYGILDSGCSNTVCGERWLAKFTEKLSDEERQEMKLEPSDQSFTFGDGRTVISNMRVTIPCWMGGVSGEITTDVVDCKIPLLLSRKSMKKVGMLLDFKKDEAIVNGRSIELKVTNSGHYALPISL